MTDLTRTVRRFAQRVKGIIGVGDNIHRRLPARYIALHAVGLLILLCACGPALSEPPTCLHRDAACLKGVERGVRSQVRDHRMTCEYVADGKPATSSKYVWCWDPSQERGGRAYGGVTLIEVGANGNWGSTSEVLPSGERLIVFLSGCVPGGMCGS